MLSDEDKRARLDRGETLDEDGEGEDGFAGGPDLEQLFSMMFGMGGMGMGGMPFFMAGEDEFDEDEVCVKYGSCGKWMTTVSLC